MCVECHSPRDAQGNLIPGEQYLGANIPFVPPWPNDWAARAPRNRGLVGYDDRAALRLLTEGAIGREDRRLRPPMPRFFMTTQDAADRNAEMRWTGGSGAFLPALRRISSGRWAGKYA